MAVLSSIGLGKEFAGHGPDDPAVLAIKSLNFTVGHDEFCSVLGHAGCRKTTPLPMVAGFEQPTAGQLLLAGKPVGKPGWERSMIFQDYALFHWLTVEENIAFGLEMKNMPREGRKGVVKDY